MDNIDNVGVKMFVLVPIALLALGFTFGRLIDKHIIHLSNLRLVCTIRNVTLNNVFELKLVWRVTVQNRCTV